jgi:hypothetical protein
MPALASQLGEQVQHDNVSPGPFDQAAAVATGQATGALDAAPDRAGTARGELTLLSAFAQPPPGAEPGPTICRKPLILLARPTGIEPCFRRERATTAIHNSPICSI